MHDISEEPDTVICVCGSEGFPRGFGGTARITLIGKSLQAAGLKFHVLHCGPSPLPENTQKSGIHEGISFEYMTSLLKPKDKSMRSLAYARAVVNLAFKLIGLRAAGKRFTVYLYVQSGPLNLIASMLCQALGISLVQEMCEWWATDMRFSSLTRWLFRSRMFKASTGLLVISKEIEQRAQERAAMLNPRLTIHRLPSVVDFDRFCAPVAPPQPGETHMPNFVWCGSIDGWMADVEFMLAALAHARLTHACQLTLVGGYSEANAAIIKKEAAALGLVVTEPRDSTVAYGDPSAGDVRLAGWVDLETLQACFRNAAALLLPLFDDERSRTRMPNKLPEYLASCKPVITSKVGDLRDFLVDGVNASLAKPGDSVDFACKMTALLTDPELAARIGTAGRQTCAQNLDYRAHVACLAEFFGNCLRKPAHLHAEGISP